MLRVLTLSTLFPNGAQPTFGIFVERQTLGLASLPDVELRVVSPVGLPPWPLSLHPHYRARSRLPREEMWKGVKVHRPRFPVVPGLGARWTARSMARALLPLLRDLRERFPFDVIDAEFFWPDGPAAMHLSRALGIPFSVKARGSDINYWMRHPRVARQIREAAAGAGGMLAVSDALARAMAERGLPTDRITTHYTCIDRERFGRLSRAEAKAKLGVQGPLLATVGALIPGKGQRDAIAAAERIDGATLLIAGEGPDRAALETMIRQRGLQQRVRLLGSRPPDEIAILMAAADVIVHPSRSEGLANVWVEALASGTPVVTYDVGGAGEVIDRPEAGTLVPPDAESIAAAVQRILVHPPEREQVMRAAERFSSEANRMALFEHLQRVARS